MSDEPISASFVVPVYKAERYLADCVASILKQTVPDFEVILVDDGSPDGSGDICDALKKQDARVKVIHQQNAGAGFARNAGLRAARGTYVYFVDADDYVEENLLAETLPLARESGADVLVYGFNAVYPSGMGAKGRTKMCLPALDGAYTHAEFVARFGACVASSFFTVWDRLFRRAYLIDNGLFFTNRAIGQDALFALMIFRHGFQKIYFHHGAYYNHVHRGGSAVHRYQPTRFECEYDVALKIDAFFEAFGLTDAFFANLVNERYVMAIAIELYNLMLKGCPLTGGEKTARLKRLMQTPRIQRAVRELSYRQYTLFRRKVMLFTLKHRLYGLCLLLKRQQHAFEIQRRRGGR